MSKDQSNNNNSLVIAVKKFFLSAFVVITFLAYILHEHLVTPAQANNGTGNSGTPTPSNGAETSVVSEKNLKAPVSSGEDDDAAPVQNNNDTATPNAVDAVSAGSTVAATPTLQPVVNNPGALYKDGTYTGSEADAYFGLVQVQAVIQNGKITSVNFLEYPNHRRTSVQINTQVMPWLQQEAIQAQSAQVDLISGATLTSQAFAESLRVALDSARN